MKLATVIDMSMQEFANRGYDKAQKAEIVMRFMRDVLGFTPVNFEELHNAGSTLVNSSPIEENSAGRFFLWYYINYMVDELANDC